jgi:AcrR family transcriptional regulator
VDDIAAEAGVSTRTFFNYFATKEQAFVADDLERGRRFLVTVAAAPDDAPVWPLLHATALAEFAATTLPDREQVLKEQLVRTSPCRRRAGARRVRRPRAGARRRAHPAHRRRLGPVPPPARQRRRGGGPGHDRDVARDRRRHAETFAALLDEAFSTLAPAFP